MCVKVKKHKAITRDADDGVDITFLRNEQTGIMKRLSTNFMPDKVFLYKLFILYLHPYFLHISFKEIVRVAML